MIRPRSPLVVLLWLAGVLSAGAAERTPPHLCPENAPEGVRLPPQPGCGSARPTPAAPDAQLHPAEVAKALRVGGRVGAEYGIGR
jgi:hypothetical protein